MVGRALLVIAQLGVREGPQLLVPFGFERIRDQPIIRVDLHVTTTGQVRLVVCAVDLLPAQAITLVDAALELLLHRQRDLERHRGNHLHEQLANGFVEAAAVEVKSPFVCKSYSR